MFQRKRTLKPRPKLKPELSLWGEPLEQHQQTHNELAPINLSFDGQRIRIVIIKGETWWVAADVCRALGLGNSRDVLTRLDDDEKGVVSTDTPGGQQEMAAVNEAGLYNLILGSRKAEAKSFKRWLTHDVLPTIRRTGTYSIAADPRITRTAKRLKCDAGTAERRVLQADMNKQAHADMSKRGAGVRDYAAWHNAGYSGLLNAEAAELRSRLGQKSRQTPLDRFSGIVLSQSLHAKDISLKVVAASEVPIPPSAEAEIHRAFAREIREADLKRLGPGHSYQVIEDPVRGKVLDIVRSVASLPDRA